MPHPDAEQEAKKFVVREANDTKGLQIYQGASTLLKALPDNHWAVATSGRTPAALTRLKFAELPVSNMLITADKVTRGKPNPKGDLFAAEDLDVEPTRCVVVGDSSAGIEAAKKTDRSCRYALLMKRMKLIMQNV